MVKLSQSSHLNANLVDSPNQFDQPSFFNPRVIIRRVQKMYKCFSGLEAPMFLSTQHFAARKQMFLVLGSDSHPLDSLTHILLNPPNIFSLKSEYVRSMFGCRLLVNIPPVRLASLSSPRNTVAGGTFLGDPAHCVFARHTSKKCREKPKGLDQMGSTQNSRSQFSWPS
jgi:hypothetical protein